MNALKLRPLTTALASAGLVCMLLSSGTAAAAPKKKITEEAATLAALEKKLDALDAQNKALADKVAKLEAAQATQVAQPAAAPQQPLAQIQQQAAVAAQAPATVKVDAATLAAMQQSIAANTAATQRTGWAANTTVSSYGEIGYTRPTKDVSASTTDVQRAVIGMQHRFDDKTKMVAEWEWEHAITSADDSGESEVEQLWVEREFDNGVKGRAGLFLMPVGLLNQTHEPTAYYGVYRPDTDTKIIPSTWREVGLGANGDLGNGLNWDVALTTAPNLAHWDAGSTEARERGPLQSIHGEGQFAAARTFGTVAALNWRGIPGLWLGGSAVFDNIGQSQSAFVGNGAKLFMIEGHARYQVGGLDLAAEAVRGQINGATRFNQALSTGDFESPTLVPHLFYGGYVQAAYNFALSGDYKLAPFARYEVLNTAAGFGSLPVSAGGIKQPDEKILTVGASLFIGEGIVLKADYRDYHQHKLPDTDEHFTLGNSLNLGVGFAF
ncbi:MAG: hypothetical protein ABIR54_10230 [Burkholderiaceae bacterium]|jgi:hypothetical protein